MAADYYNTPPLPQKGPFLLHEAFTPSLLLIVALCIPRQSWITTSVFLPAILAAHYRLLHTASGSPSVGFSIGTYAVMHTYLALNLLVFSNPQRDFRRLSPIYGSVTDGTSAKKTPKHLQEEWYPQDSLLRRLGWVIELTESCRGIGWNWQIRPIPRLDPRELTSIQTFFRRRAVRLLLIWVWLDILCWYIRDIDTAYFFPESNAFRNPDTFIPPYRSLFSVPSMASPPPRGFPEMPHGEDAWLVRGTYALFLHTLRIVLSASAMYAAINGQYTALAVQAASLGCIFGLGEEEDWRRRWLDWRAWPDLFGGWKEGDWGYGILGWWGTAWHGLFKNSFTTPGRFITSSLGLSKNGPAAIAVNLTLPFIMSGILHFAGCFSQSGGGLGCVRFFLLQPLGIMLERTFVHVYRQFAPSAVRSAALETAVPYLWTVCWFVAVSRSFFDEYGYGGVWSVEPIPISAIRGIRGDGWWHLNPSIEGGDWWRWHESLGGWGIQL